MTITLLILAIAALVFCVILSIIIGIKNNNRKKDLAHHKFYHSDRQQRIIMKILERLWMIDHPFLFEVGESVTTTEKYHAQYGDSSKIIGIISSRNNDYRASNDVSYGDVYEMGENLYVIAIPGGSTRKIKEEHLKKADCTFKCK